MEMDDYFVQIKWIRDSIFFIGGSWSNVDRLMILTNLNRQTEYIAGPVDVEDNDDILMLIEEAKYQK